jgi:hypothetical protein
MQAEKSMANLRKIDIEPCVIDGEMSIKLNECQRLAAQMLAMGHSGKSVATELGVAPETVSRWRQEPIFNRYLNSMLVTNQEIIKQRLAGMATKALDILDETLDDPLLPTKDRYILGLKILELCRVKEIELKFPDNQLEEEIAEYEAFLHAMTSEELQTFNGIQKAARDRLHAARTTAKNNAAL